MISSPLILNVTAKEQCVCASFVVCWDCVPVHPTRLVIKELARRGACHRDTINKTVKQSNNTSTRSYKTCDLGP